MSKLKLNCQKSNADMNLENKSGSCCRKNKGTKSDACSSKNAAQNQQKNSTKNCRNDNKKPKNVCKACCSTKKKNSNQDLAVRAMSAKGTNQDLAVRAMSAKGTNSGISGQLAKKYLSSETYFEYGLHFDKKLNEYRIGQLPATIIGDDILVKYEEGEVRYVGTEGLWRLLTQDMSYFEEDDYFDDKDWVIYMAILLAANKPKGELAPRSNVGNQGASSRYFEDGSKGVAPFYHGGGGNEEVPSYNQGFGNVDAAPFSYVGANVGVSPYNYGSESMGVSPRNYDGGNREPYQYGGENTGFAPYSHEGGNVGAASYNNACGSQRSTPYNSYYNGGNQGNSSTNYGGNEGISAYNFGGGNQVEESPYNHEYRNSAPTQHSYHGGMNEAMGPNNYYEDRNSGVVPYNTYDEGNMGVNNQGVSPFYNKAATSYHGYNGGGQYSEFNNEVDDKHIAKRNLISEMGNFYLSLITVPLGMTIDVLDVVRESVWRATAWNVNLVNTVGKKSGVYGLLGSMGSTIYDIIPGVPSSSSLKKFWEWSQCTTCIYLKELDELIRVLIALQSPNTTLHCGFTQSCMLFWILEHIVVIIGQEDGIEQLLDWTRINKKLIIESNLINQLKNNLPWGYHHKKNPISSSLNWRTRWNKKCAKQVKRYDRLQESSANMFENLKLGMAVLEDIFSRDKNFFLLISHFVKDINCQDLNIALERGLKLLKQYYN